MMTKDAMSSHEGMPQAVSPRVGRAPRVARATCAPASLLAQRHRPAPRVASPSAASLLYSIVLTTTILVIAGTMSASFVRASQRNHDMFRSAQAVVAARAAAEWGQGVYSLSDLIGYETNGTQDADPNNAFTPVDTTATYEVFSRSKWLAWREGSTSAPNGACNLSNVADCYVVPMPGTGGVGGGAAEDSACDFTRPDATGQDWDTPTIAGLNHDCNWNKIGYEETVTIPLYYEVSDGSCTDGICNPAEPTDTLDTLILRVRTPDVNGDGTRETLAGDDEVILNWEISGDCDTDGNPTTATETCYMVANPGPPSSYITGNSINANPTYEVLSVNFPSPNVKGMTNMFPTGTFRIDNFLRFTTPFEILTPILKLSVIYPLTNSSNNARLPYLEYQLLTEREISDNKVISKGSARAQGRLGSYVGNSLSVRDLGSNAIINFAVQN